MHVAFHFDEALTRREEYLTPLRDIERRTISSILRSIPLYRQHVRIRSGIPSVSSLPRGRALLHKTVTSILIDASVWRTIGSVESYADTLASRQVSIELIEGVTLADAIAIHTLLKEC